MKKNVRTLVLSAVCALALVSGAAAQTTGTQELMYHWGALHLGPGQALAINLELTDHFGDPMSVPVELELQDQDGKVIYRGSLTLSDGRAISFAVGPEIRTLPNTIPADLYAAIGPDVRLLIPCLKVAFPPGPNSPVDRLTPTLEVIDLFTGRVQSLGATPRAIIAIL